MGILSDDPLTQVAFSVYENKGVFAVLLGSGVSRAADIPTGWEITLDLIRRVGTAQGTNEQTSWEQWYREQTGSEPDYSALIKELASSPQERRSILHTYIEPTKQDRDEGKKVPTAAHNAIADLVLGGYIHVIVTTNFDRLMENSLRDHGIEPTIVASVDALTGAEPITHTSCYILKLHGDYKDSRIRNTDAELSKYPGRYNTLLARIFDEYGLIICGWSGEWDVALRAAFLRTPNRRYPVYWTVRNRLSDHAKTLVDHRRARVIEIESANKFFTSLSERVQTIAHSHQKNPVSTDLLVNSTKRYLSKPEYRIQLVELFADEVDNLLARLESFGFDTHSSVDEDEFRSRVSSYESATEPLARLVGVLGRWEQGDHSQLVLDMLQSIFALADKERSGKVIWLGIRSYPAVLLFTAYSLGLARADRWKALHRFFCSEVPRRHQDPEWAVQALFLYSWAGAQHHDVWRKLEGYDRRKTALSDHLFDVMSSLSKSFVDICPDFEFLFEKFEILAALAFLESADIKDIERGMANANQFVFTPVGRSSWNRSVRQRIINELKSEEFESVLLGAGFGKGDSNFLRKSIENYEIVANRLDARA